MTRSIRFISLSVLTAVLLPLSACGGGGHSSAEKYFLVATNTKIPYWQEASAGLLKSATELGVQAEMVGPDSFDPKAEKEEFRKAVAKKPAGILVSPGDPDLLSEDINSAVAAGIPVITIDSDAPKSKRLLFVGTNNHDAGIVGGRQLAKRLNGKGNVIIFTIAGQINLEERLGGYKEALVAYPGVKIVEVVDMKGDPRLVFDKMMEIVEKQKEKADAFAGLEAQSGSEIAEVLDRKKVEGKIVVAMDTTASTLGWIEKGKIEFTISQKPFTMTHYGLRILADIKEYKLPSLTANFTQDSHSPLPVFVDTGLALVDKNNLAEYRQTSASK